ncbi:micronuclear linker histone polyprotein-like [Actinia tenebrosa]|uniref:Micronuclear linker histone polyprotein-like n=1 Tax=Actinia tenebrosa TaxID=6105 RepID=A0A6P8J3X2_ACTTE|nr:micronuclear linker histone polyprotein-like [Actinia tenebrosa]
MRLYTIVALLIVVILTLDALGECEGWFGGRSRSRSSSSSSMSRSTSVGRSRGSSRRTSSSRRTGGIFGGGSRRSSSRSTSRTSRTRSTSRTSAGSRRRSSTRRTSGGFWGGSRKTSNNSPSKTKTVSIKKTERGTTITAGKTKAHVNNFGKIRDRDETGHRTGLGTLAKKMVSQPGKTIDAIKSFAKSYKDMKKKNVVGGNLPAHRQANKDATSKSDAQTAGAISALREQYKNFRIKQNKDGSIHIGDTRTKKERDDTMNANKQGRDDAKKKGSN